MLVEDLDLSGAIAVPVLSTKCIGVPTAFVELDAFFKQTMAAAGTSERLVQTFPRDGTHSYISDASYVALMQSLSHWLRTGSEPTPASVAARCQLTAPQSGGNCTFEPSFQPQPLQSRVLER